MEYYNNLPNEIKIYIVSFFDRECVRCNKKIIFLNKDEYYMFVPPLLNNDEFFEGYTICPLCLFFLKLTS